MGPLSRDIVVVGVSDSSLTVRKEYPVPERRDRVGECDAMIQHHPELRFRVVEVAVEPNVEEVGGGGGLARWQVVVRWESKRKATTKTRG
jgi:hypothetical protein